MSTKKIVDYLSGCRYLSARYPAVRHRSLAVRHRSLAVRRRSLAVRQYLAELNKKQFYHLKPIYKFEEYCILLTILSPAHTGQTGQATGGHGQMGKISGLKVEIGY